MSFEDFQLKGETMFDLSIMRKEIPVRYAIKKELSK